MSTSENKADASQKQESRFTLDRAIEVLENLRQAKSGLRNKGELRGQVMRGRAEKLLTRTMSGTIYTAVVLACIFAGKLPTALCITAMSWLCCSEFYRIARMSGRAPHEIFGLGAAIVYPVSVYFWGFAASSFFIFIHMLLLAIWYVLTPRANLADVAISIFGPLYTSLMFSSVILIRNSDPGLTGALLTFGIMGSIWANDATAYFVGSRFGAHKLAPKISPHKSWEGFYGGLAGSVLVWIIVGILGLKGIHIGYAVLCGFLVGISSVMGDLFESRIKRGVGVKDSGNFMPGHGGLLDRSDSMLFGCMVAYILLRIGGIL
ncbi:MAG: phosphatidate cytidylyltransferase [Atopobiaceae bacterium]